jgi:hypothetical protein
MVIGRSAFATAVLILVIGATGASAAVDSNTRRMWSAACRHDAFTFCRWQALEYNVPGVRDCLIRNLDRISEACRGVIKAAGSQHDLPPAISAAPAPH